MSAFHDAWMARLPTLPLAISIRGAPLPKLANRGFRGVRVRPRRDGTVNITERASGTWESRVVGFFQEFMPLFWFMVVWMSLLLCVGAFVRFDERVMFPLCVVGGPSFFMLLLKRVYPRLRAMPAVNLQLSPGGWNTDDVADGSIELPRALAASAVMVPEVNGKSTVVVTSSNGRKSTVASHLSSHDAGRLVDLLREYGQHG